MSMEIALRLPDLQHRALRLGKVWYVFIVALLATISSVTLGLLWRPAVDAKDESILYLVIANILLAPFLETLLCQALPWKMCRHWGVGRVGQFLAMSIPFALLHLQVSFFSTVSAFIGGVIFAATFLIWENEALKVRVLLVFAIHALHNALATWAAATLF